MGDLTCALDTTTVAPSMMALAGRKIRLASAMVKPCSSPPLASSPSPMCEKCSRMLAPSNTADSNSGPDVSMDW